MVNVYSWQDPDHAAIYLIYNTQYKCVLYGWRVCDLNFSLFWNTDKLLWIKCAKETKHKSKNFSLYHQTQAASDLSVKETTTAHASDSSHPFVLWGKQWEISQVLSDMTCNTVVLLWPEIKSQLWSFPVPLPSLSLYSLSNLSIPPK